MSSSTQSKQQDQDFAKLLEVLGLSQSGAKLAASLQPPSLAPLSSVLFMKMIVLQAFWILAFILFLLVVLLIALLILLASLILYFV